MKEMMLLTKEEYEELDNKIKALQAKLERAGWRVTSLHYLCSEQEERANKLWDLLNRPAIEAAAEKRDTEFYDWCAEKAAEYEKLDEAEWISDRARFYNNGMFQYAKAHRLGNSCEEIERYRKYGDGCRHWYTTTLLRECDDEEIEVLKTEGWTELYGKWYRPSRGYEPYWMIYDYQNELFHRWCETENNTEKEKIWNLRESLEDLFWDQDTWK